MNKKRIMQASTFFAIVLWGCLIAWLSGIDERSFMLGFIVLVCTMIAVIAVSALEGYLDEH